jgi:hypothetical protein
MFRDLLLSGCRSFNYICMEAVDLDSINNLGRGIDLLQNSEMAMWGSRRVISEWHEEFSGDNVARLWRWSSWTEWAEQEREDRKRVHRRKKEGKSLFKYLLLDYLESIGTGKCDICLPFSLVSQSHMLNYVHYWYICAWYPNKVDGGLRMGQYRVLLYSGSVIMSYILNFILGLPAISLLE